MAFGDFHPERGAELGAATLAGHVRSRSRELRASDLSDLLTDLAHLAEREGWDFGALAEGAIYNREREVKDAFPLAAFREAA